MRIWPQALRLALLIELSTVPVFFEWASQTIRDGLFWWFIYANLPTMFLFRHHAWQSRGQALSFEMCTIPIYALQTGFWFLVWYGLISAYRKWRGNYAA